MYIVINFNIIHFTQLKWRRFWEKTISSILTIDITLERWKSWHTLNYWSLTGVWRCSICLKLLVSPWILLMSELFKYYTGWLFFTIINIFRELSTFIATGRLHCKIDRVGGIVETNRPDLKNAQFNSVVKQGDLLLQRVQKLSRVINI